MSRPFSIAERFRGFLPVVVDVETGGFNAKTDALLEIAAVFVEKQRRGGPQAHPSDLVESQLRG